MLASIQRDHRLREVTADPCIYTSTGMAAEVKGKVVECCRPAQQALGACSCSPPAQACAYVPLATSPQDRFAGSPGTAL